MSANVESLFYTDADGRNVPWHGIGVRVIESPNSEDALRVAGLDWEVKQTESFVVLNGVQTPTIEIWCDADARKRMTDTNNIPTLEDLIKEGESKTDYLFDF